MKDRNIICEHYIRHGECSKGKEADLYKVCQHCALYSKKIGAKPHRTDNRRRKLDKIQRKERWRLAMLFNFNNDLINQAATYYVMQSEENADKVKRLYKNRVYEGLVPEEALPILLKELNLQYSDITTSDLITLQSVLQDIYKRHLYGY